MKVDIPLNKETKPTSFISYGIYLSYMAIDLHLDLCAFLGEVVLEDYHSCPCCRFSLFITMTPISPALGFATLLH